MSKFVLAFTEWVQAHSGQVMPFGERLRVEENLRRVCAVQPREAAAVLSGMLHDLAYTLPFSDPWRQLLDRMTPGDNVYEYATYDALNDDVPGGDGQGWPYEPLPFQSLALAGVAFSSPELVPTIFWSMILDEPETDRPVAIGDRDDLPTPTGTLNAPVYSYATRTLLLFLWRRQCYGVEKDRVAVTSARLRAGEVESADHMDTFRLSHSFDWLEDWRLRSFDED